MRKDETLNRGKIPDNSLALLHEFPETQRDGTDLLTNGTINPGKSGKSGPTIVQIIPDLDTGGAELSAIEIAGAIVEAGGRSIVLSRGGRMEGDLAKAGGELVRFPAATKNPAKIISNAYAIARLIRKEGAAIIHARSRAPAWSALMAAKQTGIPFVTTYHGAYNEKGRIKRLYNSVMARSDIVVANSHYTSRLVQERYGTPEDRIRVIHRGVDMEQFDPAAIGATRIAELRNQWGLKEGERAVLHPARLTSWKGQGSVIAAAGLLKAKGLLEGIAFILAGDAQGRDAYAQGLRAQIEEAGLGDSVRLVGHVSDMPAAYGAADAAIVASIEPEAFGRTATEAQAMGCPVIATRIGAPPETVLAHPQVERETATGWLVPPGEADALAAALGELLIMSPDAVEAMGKRARQRVADNFSLNSMKKRTLNVYDEILSSNLTETFLRRSRS
ncbi:MAG: glycosyltransferase family 4 protein [Alphaproteobacteria bacterium]|nr:glycosyltransferase family 4 protein [Alphaproteobacteria bacterium]